MSRDVSAKIHARIEALGPDADDLLFRLETLSAPRRRIPETLPDAATLDLTDPNAAGRRYCHGTATGYGAGRCRCRYASGGR